MVFITASPVLSFEVKRYFGQLKDQLIAHLEAKEILQQPNPVVESGSESEGEEVINTKEEKEDLNSKISA
jgi:hypothetical protein